MVKRNVISFAPTGLIKLYYDKIKIDIVKDINDSIKNGVESSSGNTAVLSRIISRYYALQYGQDEQRKMRNIHFKDMIDDIEGDQTNLVRQHEANSI